jgi:hypothetical protein
MFPRGFVLGVVIPLNSIELSGLLASDSVLLIQNLDGIGLVRHVWLQWHGIFNYYISRRLQASFELGDKKHIVNS